MRERKKVTINLTSGQLNDVLKSLTTVDLGGGKVTSISYNTDDGASRKLGALPLPLDEGHLGGGVPRGAARRSRRGLVRRRRLDGSRAEHRVSARRLEDGKGGGRPGWPSCPTRESSRTARGHAPHVRPCCFEGDLRGEIRRYLDVSRRGAPARRASDDHLDRGHG